MDSDRVMVMDQGRIVEFASPVSLLSRVDGVFTKLVKHTGEQSAEYLLQLAKEAHEAKQAKQSSSSSSGSTLVISTPVSTTL